MRRGVGLAALAVACSVASERPAGTFVAPGFSADRLGTERVAVLPVDAVELPDALPRALDADSLEGALAGYAGEAAAQALLRLGVAGRAPGPEALESALEAVGPVHGRAYEAVLRAPPGAETGGDLGSDAGEAYRTLSEVVGAEFFLVPVSLRFEVVAPLRFRGVLDAALVDAVAGRILWRGRVAAENPLPPPGDAPDLFAAALGDATAAAAGRLADRIAAADGIEGGPSVDELER